jgi:ATP-dependent helicase/nuclease subunit A
MDNTEIASNPLYNIWISASAGSGKTKLLTDRVLRLLLAGVNPAKILCLTYTKAAAAEMLHRITSELSNWITLDDTKLHSQILTLTGTEPNVEILKFARTLLISILDSKYTIKIQTIHSFCQSIIAKFPIEAGVNLKTQILDEYQKQILLSQATQNLLKSYNQSAGQQLTLKPLLNNIHEFSFYSLVENALLYRHKVKDILQLGKDSDIIREVYNRFGIDYTGSTEEIFKEFASIYDKLISCYENILKTILLEEEKPFLVVLLEFYNASLEEKQKIFSKLYESFYTTNHSFRKILLSNKLVEQYSLEDFIFQLRNIVADYVELSNTYKIAEYTSSFVYLIYLVHHHYEELKKEGSYMDYDDLINTTLKLLSSEQFLQWVAFKLDNKIEHLLVDESQDVSLDQWQIITSLTENFFYDLGQNNMPRTIFCVGDQKQSIFSFQGADPRLFSSIKNQYHEYTSTFDIKLHNITLNKSFRSGIAILQAVDATFNQLILNNPQAFVENYVNHIAHKINISSRVEVWPAVLYKKQTSKEGYTWQFNVERCEVYDPAKILANVIANEIKHWLKQPSQIQPQDIMILVRKRDRFSEYLVRSLRHNDIPITGLDRIKLFNNIVIKDLIALGNFILLPHDDYNLASLLKSPLINLTAEQLFLLSQRENRSLWQNLKLLANSNDEFSRIYLFLDSILSTYSMQVYNLYAYILETKELRKNIIARFGIHINEILDEFLNICLEYEQKENKSLQQFLQWFATSNVEIKREIDTNINSVRIMTVHAAKGLQAKIVIIADTLGLPKHHKQVIWSEELNLPIYNGNGQNNNKLYNDTISEIETHSLQEYYRLLYVAMTRAQEKLVMCGWSMYDNISNNSWYNVVKLGVQNIGQIESCNSLGEYEIIADSMTTGTPYFYSNTKEKIILENKGQVSDHKVDINDDHRRSSDLPECILSKPNPSGNKKHISASHLRSSKFLYSPLDFNSDANFGNIIHKILEISIKSSNNINLSNLIIKYADHYKIKLSEKIVSNIEELVQKLKASFSPTTKILPEASVAASLTQANIKGTIDLLVVDEGLVTIIDYKTKLFNNMEEIPIQYIAQLAVYKYLVSNIYVGKSIKCLIISTINGQFFEINNGILDEQFIEHLIHCKS